MAKAPIPGRTRQPSRVRVGFNGRDWPFSVSEITPRDAADLRRETGAAVKHVIASFQSGDADIDTAGAIIFLARRQGESRTITFDQATAGLSYESDVTVHVEGEPDNEDAFDPEA